MKNLKGVTLLNLALLIGGAGGVARAQSTTSPDGASPESTQAFSLPGDAPSATAAPAPALSGIQGEPSIFSTLEWEKRADLSLTPDVEEFATDVVKEWVQVDPEGAAAWVGQLPESESYERDGCLEIVAEAWAQKNLPAAVEWVATTAAHGLGKDDLIATVMKEWAKQDPAVAAAWTELLPEGASREKAQAAIVDIWVTKAPQAALEWIDHLSRSQPLAKPDDPNPLIGDLMWTWASKDPEGAATAASLMLRGPLRVQALDYLPLELWTMKDRASAVGWATRLQDEEARTVAIPEVALGWTMVSPRAAAVWVVSLPEGESKRRALASIASMWSYQDFHVGTELIRSVGEKLENQRVVVDSLNLDNWVAANPREVAQWALRLPAGGGREIAVSRTAEAWAAQDLPAAMKWAEQLGDPQTVLLARQGIVTEWASTEPEAASVWLKTLPKEGRETLVSALAFAWGAQDPKAAARWLVSLPQESGRDKVILAFTQAWSAHDDSAIQTMLDLLKAASQTGPSTPRLPSNALTSATRMAPVNGSVKGQTALVKE